MLYLTTRSKRDAYTAHRVLREGRGPDGGLYIPLRKPAFSEEDIAEFARLSFNECIAHLLNLQFNTHLTGAYVDLALGRYSVRLKKLNQRIIMAECWHNTAWNFSGMVNALLALLWDDSDGEPKGDWIYIATGIAVLFGFYGELNRAGISNPDTPFDISFVSGDFVLPMSAWYARAWGLPVGNIVCSCNENSELWNFICHGQLRMDTVAVNTAVPEADVAVPKNLERLISAVVGPEEALRYVACARLGQTYYCEGSLLSAIRKGLFVSVVSQPRMSETIPNVFGSIGYILSPYDAIAYAGLLDYRSRTGSNRYGLVFSHRAPILELDFTAKALGTTAEELKTYIEKG